MPASSCTSTATAWGCPATSVLSGRRQSLARVHQAVRHGLSKPVPLHTAARRRHRGRRRGLGTPRGDRPHWRGRLQLWAGPATRARFAPPAIEDLSQCQAQYARAFTFRPPTSIPTVRRVRCSAVPPIPAARIRPTTSTRSSSATTAANFMRRLVPNGNGGYDSVALRRRLDWNRDRARAGHQPDLRLGRRFQQRQRLGAEDRLHTGERDIPSRGCRRTRAPAPRRSPSASPARIERSGRRRPVLQLGLRRRHHELRGQPLAHLRGRELHRPADRERWPGRERLRDSGDQLGQHRSGDHHRRRLELPGR